MDIKENVKIDFQQLVEYSLNPTIIIDNNIIVYINKSGVELLGVKHKKNIIGDSFHNYLHPDFHFICCERMRRIIEKEEVVELAEQKLIKSDGEIIDVQVMAAPFRIGDKILVQANYLDITERKQTQQLLIQSEKLSVIGELAAGILHEIRNPLTAIKGFLQFMMTGTFKKEYLSVIKSEVERIEDIANELLFFAKPNNEHFQTEDINDIIKKTLFLFENEVLKKRITVVLNLEDKNLKVLGNNSQLKQVFLNIIKNVIEACSEHGNIEIKLKKDANFASISIKDNGIGITKDKLKKLGQPFFSTKEKGTGLGLMITYNIIKHHNGQISITSEEGVGTTFKIRLPLHYN